MTPPEIASSPGYRPGGLCTDRFADLRADPRAGLCARYNLIEETAGDLAEQATAVFSHDRVYRYELTRRWAIGAVLTFVMLNPSKASASMTDPTISRCRRRAWDNGYGGLRVLNLYGLGATNPDHLKPHPDPVGPANDAMLRECLGLPDQTVVCAWGCHPMVHEREKAATELLQSLGIEPLCLGRTIDGHPRHPLFVAGVQPLAPFIIQEAPR